MALEYIEEIIPASKTVTGVTDESYPVFSMTSVYPKGDKVIFGTSIYEANHVVVRATYYVYDNEANELYVPSTQTYLSTAIFSATNEFEQRFIYVDNTNILYKYIGATDLTIAPDLIDFTDTLTWENQGIQLNGYAPNILYPDVYPLYWTNIGKINSEKAFDISNSSQTIADGETMTFVFQTSKADRIALFNLDAAEVTVKTHLGGGVEDPTNTVTTTYSLYTREGLHFYEILTADIITDKVSYISIPPAGIQEITLTITNVGDTAKVGDITIGKSRTIGVVLDGLNHDIKDYSTYSSDASATDNYAEGGYRKVATFTVSFPTLEADNVISALDARRGKVTVYNLNPKSNEAFLKVKGFLRSRPVSYISNSNKSKINIKIEGRMQ